MYPLSVVSESYKMKESESESQEAHANAKAESAELTVTEGTTSGSKENPTQFTSVSKWLDHIVATKFPDMYKSELPKKRKIDEVDSDDKDSRIGDWSSPDRAAGPDTPSDWGDSDDNTTHAFRAHRCNRCITLGRCCHCGQPLGVRMT